MKISIITSPFGVLPPSGIGAVEKLWYDIAKELLLKECDITMYSKTDIIKNNDQNLKIVYVDGYNRTGKIYFDLIFDFLYSFKVLMKLKKTDILVLNTFFSPILSRLFKNKYKKLVYNVARIPKGQFFIYGNVDSFVCPSLAVKILLANECKSLINKIEVIGNPVNTGVYKYKEIELKNSEDSFNILFFGRIHPEKGVHILSDAIQEINKKGFDLVLTLIGTYDLNQGGGGDEYFNSVCKDKEFIKYIKPISNPELLYNEVVKCDIFCYPSIADNGETFGVSVIEAMSAGRPVIVSDLNCFKDFVIDNFNGLVFNHKSSDPKKALMDKIILLINNPLLRTKLSIEANITAKKFSNSVIALENLANFEKLIKNNG
jgi:glycosyltransferase involved in cell wall biosynthesis